MPGVVPYAYKKIQARIASRNPILIHASPEAERARTDFLEFRRHVCDHESPAHHQRWTELLITNEDSKSLKRIGGKNTLILSPRGSAKSTFQVEFTAWIIGTHTSPEYKIPLKVLYVSYSIEVAMLKSEQIQKIIASPRYQEVFPHIRPGTKWGQKLWDIDKGLADLPAMGEPYTLACAGMKGAVASKRAHIVVFDDLIKSPEQILNPTIRERMEDNWSNVIRPVMYEGARAFCLGTRMSALDIYATTFTAERGWQVIEESAIVEDEETGEERSYWEEHQSLAYLNGLRADDPSAFSLQFQNKIPEDSEGIIHPDWIVDGNPPQLDDFDILAISSDFSSSLKQKADYTVFLLWGIKDDKYWILDMKRGRWSGNIDKCDALLTMLIDWEILECETEYHVDYRSGRVTWFLGEGESHPKIYDKNYFLNFYSDGQSYQLSFKGDWINYVQDKIGIYNISNFPLQAKGDKLQRLRGTTGLLQRGQILFNKYRRFKVLKRELINFGNTAKDDCVDAFTLGIIGIGVRAKLDY
jgi:hypothetical protein